MTDSVVVVVVMALDRVPNRDEEGVAHRAQRTCPGVRAHVLAVFFDCIAPRHWAKRIGILPSVGLARWQRKKNSVFEIEETNDNQACSNGNLRRYLAVEIGFLPCPCP